MDKLERRMDTASPANTQGGLSMAQKQMLPQRSVSIEQLNSGSMNCESASSQKKHSFP